MLTETDLREALRLEASSISAQPGLSERLISGGRRRLRRHRARVTVSVVAVASVVLGSTWAITVTDWRGQRDSIVAGSGEPRTGMNAVVPDVVGLTRQQAWEAMGSAFAGSPGRYVASATVPRGVVIAQTPVAGTESANLPVELVYSAGGPVRAVKDLPPQAAQRIRRDATLAEQGMLVLVFDTASGPAYKSDDVLTGTCAATAAALPFLRAASAGGGSDGPDNFEESCY